MVSAERLTLAGAQPSADNGDHPVPRCWVSGLALTDQAALQKGLDVGDLDVVPYRPGSLGAGEQAAQRGHDVVVTT